MLMRRNRQKGFTLIELLIVVAIIGIIAAILIPNLLDALQKAKQKRTVADMRNTGTAWMSWLTDQVGAASAGSAKTYNASNFLPQDYSVIFGHLNQSSDFFYMQDVPQLDGWGGTYAYARNPLLVQSSVMIICSSGRDLAFEGSSCNQSWTVQTFKATNYDEDIVWADGYFVRNPG